MRFARRGKFHCPPAQRTQTLTTLITSVIGFAAVSPPGSDGAPTTCKIIDLIRAALMSDWQLQSSHNHNLPQQQLYTHHSRTVTYLCNYRTHTSLSGHRHWISTWGYPGCVPVCLLPCSNRRNNRSFHRTWLSGNMEWIQFNCSRSHRANCSRSCRLDNYSFFAWH